MADAWGAGIASIKETGNYWTIVEDNTIENNQDDAIDVYTPGSWVKGSLFGTVHRSFA